MKGFQCMMDSILEFLKYGSHRTIKISANGATRKIKIATQCTACRNRSIHTCETMGNIDFLLRIADAKFCGDRCQIGTALGLHHVRQLASALYIRTFHHNAAMVRIPFEVYRSYRKNIVYIAPWPRYNIEIHGLFFMLHNCISYYRCG